MTIPDTVASPGPRLSSQAKRPILLGGCAKPFPLCLLMLQKWAVRSFWPGCLGLGHGRRATRSEEASPNKGGWHIYHTGIVAADTVDPTQKWIRAAGDQALNGWAKNPGLEAEIANWFDASESGQQHAIVGRINRAATEEGGLRSAAEPISRNTRSEATLPASQARPCHCFGVSQSIAKVPPARMPAVAA